MRKLVICMWVLIIIVFVAALFYVVPIAIAGLFTDTVEVVKWSISGN